MPPTSWANAVSWPWPNDGRADPHGRDAVGLDRDLRELLRREPRDLDVRRHADPQRGAVAASAPLPPARRGARRSPHSSSARSSARCVLPVVVGRRPTPSVRKRVGRDQVLPAKRHGIHAELRREQVDGALDARRGLGTAGAPVGAERGHVRHDRASPERDLGDRVDAGDHLRGRLAHERPELRIGADVAQELEAQRR